MSSSQEDKLSQQPTKLPSVSTHTDADHDAEERTKPDSPHLRNVSHLRSPIPAAVVQPCSRVGDDIFIQDTNNDAAKSKRFAVKLGYWKDPYLELFVPQAPRKPPEINRGYYARVFSIYKLVKNFLLACKVSCLPGITFG